jgi:hypothetical protein
LLSAGTPKTNAPAAAEEHKFKEVKMGATLEAVKDHGVVKLYILVDDIEQYSQLIIERSDEMQNNFAQCKEVNIQKGKYKSNYLTIEDHYPLSNKMSNLYRIKTITADGIMRMYPAVPIIFDEKAEK